MLLNYKVWLEEFASQYFPDEYVTGEYKESKKKFDVQLLSWEEVLLSVLSDAGYDYEKWLDAWVVLVKIIKDNKQVALYKIKEFHAELWAVLTFVEHLDWFRDKEQLNKLTLERQLNKLKNAREDFGKLDGYGAVKISTGEFIAIVDESIEVFSKLI